MRTDVPGIEERKDCADGEEVVELMERHFAEIYRIPKTDTGPACLKTTRASRAQLGVDARYVDTRKRKRRKQKDQALKEGEESDKTTRSAGK